MSPNLSSPPSPSLTLFHFLSLLLSLVNANIENEITPKPWALNISDQIGDQRLTNKLTIVYSQTVKANI